MPDTRPVIIEFKAVGMGGILPRASNDPQGRRARLPVAVPRLCVIADNRLSVRDRELFSAEPHIASGGCRRIWGRLTSPLVSEPAGPVRSRLNPQRG
jgi:hypothetical protein